MLTTEALGQRIAQERERAGLTQGQLAAALGLEPTAVKRIEQGSQALDTHQLSVIADALGCPPMVFFAPEDEPSELLSRMLQAGRSEGRGSVKWIDSFVWGIRYLTL